MGFQRFVGRICVVFALAVTGLADPCCGQSKDDVRLYFFTMTGCGPCEQVAPVIEAFLAAGYPIQKIDARLQPEWSQRFSVTTTPTLVMTLAGRELNRRSGVIDSANLQTWFEQTIRSLPSPNPSSQTALTELDSQAPSARSAAELQPLPTTVLQAAALPDTTHQGTRQPANSMEQQALGATIRLQVEDDTGISTATGTVIHSVQGESLVITCGHVFRETQGRGKISADVNWLGDQPRTVPGELITFDSGPPDVALVLIRPGFEIKPVPLAARTSPISVGQPIFSIGCDRNAPPTIRRSQIKNIAEYDRSKKYDIHGRPVLGRSGGGLFNSNGQLVGVCNAAAVDVDEGIYSSLENLYRQLEVAHLVHLFPSDEAPVLALNRNPDETFTRMDPPTTPAELVPIESTVQGTEPIASAIPNRFHQAANNQVTGPISSTTAPEYEAIVILRPRQSAGEPRTIVIEQPSQAFLDYLQNNGSAGGSEGPAAVPLFAERPIASPSQLPAMDRALQIRAQSPR